MDLRQLRHFIAVAEELHFGKAAERLHMTQPPLSQSIQALEAELGVRLFERTKRHVELTPVGAQWEPYAREALEHATALPHIARRLQKGEIGTLRLAFVSIADYSVLPRLLREYHARHPHMEVALREATSDLQIQALLAGETDAGLVIPTQGPLPAELEYLPLLREPLIAAVPEAWVASGEIKASADGTVSLRQLERQPLILFPRQSAPVFHDQIVAFYVQNQSYPQFGQQAIQMQTIISLVSAGLGVALVPESLRNLARTGVRYLNMREPAPQIETGLAWRRDHSLPALRHLVALARDIQG